MAGYNDNTPLLSTGPGNSGPDGPAVIAARLWSGGLAAAIVAALAGLVGVLVVRAVFRIAMYGPRSAGVFAGSGTTRLCLAAAVAALAATGLVHFLVLSTPRPLAYFGWIVGLVTAAATVTPFLTVDSLAVMLATAVIHLVIGLAIGSLVSGAAAGATVRRPPLTR
jgi:hypothetical protein